MTLHLRKEKAWLLLARAESYNVGQVLAAKERTVPSGEVLSQAKTRVWGLSPQNETGTGALCAVTSTLVWGWRPFYDGTAVGRLDQRYYAVGAGRFGTADPGGIRTANPLKPQSWNRYSYVLGDPINSTDRHGRERDCDLDEEDGCDTDPCDNSYDATCSGDPTPRPPTPDPPGGGNLGPANPCAWGNLGTSQQGMVTQSVWSGFSAAQQQEFMDITLDAAAIGVNLSGLQLASITIAGENGQTQTEVNFTGNTSQLIASLQAGSFTSNTTDGMVGKAHEGFDGNYRQNTLTWSMQVNTNSGGAQIDIDPFNPAGGLAGLITHGLLQVLPNKITGKDTNPFTAAGALAKRKINMGAPCTGH